MNEEQSVKDLASHFQILGAHDPEGWAKSQIHEGIPQYARFIFLRQTWKSFISEDDTSWMEKVMAAAERQPRGPGSAIGPALKRMLAAGITRDDITDVVRGMQWKVISKLAYQINNSGDVTYPKPNMPEVAWELFEVDDDGKPLNPIPGLHESVLDTDPTGREMRPRGVTRAG
jgi:hypothetical protein